MNEKKERLARCAMCGSRRVERRMVTVSRLSGRSILVEAEVCRSCGEKYFDDDAVRQIEEADPKRRRARITRRAN